MAKTPLYMLIAQAIEAKEQAFMKADDPALQKAEKQRQYYEAELNSVFSLGSPSGHSIRISPLSTSNKLSMDVLYRHSPTTDSLFTVVIAPSLTEYFKMKITGRDKKGVLDEVRKALIESLTKEYYWDTTL